MVSVSLVFLDLSAEWQPVEQTLKPLGLTPYAPGPPSDSRLPFSIPPEAPASSSGYPRAQSGPFLFLPFTFSLSFSITTLTAVTTCIPGMLDLAPEAKVPEGQANSTSLFSPPAQHDQGSWSYLSRSISVNGTIAQPGEQVTWGPPRPSLFHIMSIIDSANLASRMPLASSTSVYLCVTCCLSGP